MSRSALIFLLLAFPSWAEAQIRSMRVHGVVPGPYGWHHFCERTPDQCMKGSTEHTKYVVTKERLLELDTVNRWVNQNVKPMTDRQLYKVEEYWTIPIELRGDCEDYALLKRHLLIRRGWPAGALLMTVVVDAHGENHAVLTVRTSIGDYVLDNQSDRILLWHDTAFKRWIMRQSYIDPNVWMALDLKILTTAK